MPLNRSLPPLEFCRGTSPSHAANWRPFLKTEGSGTVAAIAEAVIGPTPGIVARLQLASSDLCQARFAVPVRQYAYRIRRSGQRFAKARGGPIPVLQCCRGW